MRSAMTPPSGGARAVTNAEIQSLAVRAGVAVVRMAPGWRWWLKNADGTKQNLGQTNVEVWDVLERMLPKVPVKAVKKLRWWEGDGVGVVRGDDKNAPTDTTIRVFGCAPSRAALVRMLHAYRGYERPGLGYRVKAHWDEKWSAAMAGVVAEPGIWLQYASGEKPIRVV